MDTTMTAFLAAALGVVGTRHTHTRTIAYPVAVALVAALGAAGTRHTHTHTIAYPVAAVLGAVETRPIRTRMTVFLVAVTAADITAVAGMVMAAVTVMAAGSPRSTKSVIN